MEFENLEELHKYIHEDDDFSLSGSKKLRSSDIIRLRDKIEDKEIRKKCSYELFFNDFFIKKGVHVPNFQINDNVYPTLELFNDNFEYLKARSIAVQNPKYKAKYNHLLWLSSIKHIDFAKQAVDSYFSVLKNWKYSSTEIPLNRSFSQYFENVFLLSQTINYNKDEIIGLLREVLSNNKLNDYTMCVLMKFIVDKIKKNDKLLFQEFYNYSKTKINKVEYKVIEQYLDLLILLSRKLGLDPSEFHVRYGDYHLKHIKDHNKEGLTAHFFYMKALDEYRKANNKQKLEETTVLFEQAKRKLDLKKITFELEDQSAVEMFNKLWEDITSTINNLIEKGESEDIYKYLIVEKILPNCSDFNDNVKSPLQDLVSTITYDINKNASKKKSGGIDSYSLYINNCSLRHIGLVIIKGIKSGKISFESLIHFLKDHCWFSEDFTYRDSNGDRQGFNWVELLTPSLHNFFIQMEVDIKLEKDSHLGYILAIDSHVLKFEGLLREFSRLVGAQTIEVKDDEAEARISFDKLLDNEKVKALIPVDDLAFFKYLFTSEGINLRNNVAHGFFKTENYNSATMLNIPL